MPTLNSLTVEQLQKLGDSLEEVNYSVGDYIIRQGDRGDTFYIIRTGHVIVTENCGHGNKEKFIRSLSRGDFFGERALQGLVYFYFLRSCCTLILSLLRLFRTDVAHWFYRCCVFFALMLHFMLHLFSPSIL